MAKISPALIRALITEFSQEMQADLATFPIYLEDKSPTTVEKPLVGAKALKNLIDANEMRSVNENTLTALLNCFREFIPNLQKHHLLSSSIKSFEYSTGYTFKSYINTEIPIPDGVVTLDALRKLRNKFFRVGETSATFTTYRFAFMNNSQIIRELLFIYESDSILKFRMTFYMSQNAGLNLTHCEGTILPIGASYLLVGVTNEDDARPRTLILPNLNAQTGADNFMVGVISSTSNIQHAPCSAKILLVKNEKLNLSNLDDEKTIQSEIGFYDYDEFVGLMEQATGKKNNHIIRAISNNIKNSKNDRILSSSIDQKFMNDLYDELKFGDITNID